MDELLPVAPPVAVGLKDAVELEELSDLRFFPMHDKSIRESVSLSARKNKKKTAKKLLCSQRYTNEHH